MRIATLQFAPTVGDVDGNIKRANELLKGGNVVGGAQAGIESLKPDLLVLPELALTGEYPGTGGSGLCFVMSLSEL
jgi:protein N-terminal amidase